MRPKSGQRSLLRYLSRSGADFVVIGGHAVAFHGYERSTLDVNIVYSTRSRAAGT